MSRIYGESVEKKIKAIINITLICIISTIVSCGKEEIEPTCKTCTVTVNQQITGQQGETWIESQTEYCNNEYDTIQQGILIEKKWSNNGGQNWNTQTKTRECH